MKHSLSSIICGTSYREISNGFHSVYSKDPASSLRFIMLCLSMLGLIQLSQIYDLTKMIDWYIRLVCLTVPVATGVLHTLVVWGIMGRYMDTTPDVLQTDDWKVGVMFIAGGIGLQNLLQWAYGDRNNNVNNGCIRNDPVTFFWNKVWMLPMAIDSALVRRFF